MVHAVIVCQEKCAFFQYFLLLPAKLWHSTGAWTHTGYGTFTGHNQILNNKQPAHTAAMHDNVTTLKHSLEQHGPD